MITSHVMVAKVSEDDRANSPRIGRKLKISEL